MDTVFVQELDPLSLGLVGASPTLPEQSGAYSVQLGCIQEPRVNVPR